MGNIDCKNFGKCVDGNEIEVSDKISLRISSINGSKIDTKPNNKRF
jgi:hypothetical protein